MKMLKNFGNVSLLFSMMLMFTMCSKEEATQNTASSDKKAALRSTVFKPSMQVSFSDGYLVFNSFQDFELFNAEAGSAETETVDSWETALGFKSQRNIFYEVVRAEDALDAYLESLPQAEQDRIRAGTPYHSPEHDNALANGHIRYYTSPFDQSSYWDYTLVDPSVAPAVNERGIVKVEGQLILFSNTEFIYYAKDGRMETLLDAMNRNENYDDDLMRVIKRLPYAPEGDPKVENTTKQVRGLCWSGPHTNTFTKTNDWRYPQNRRRCKVWVDGFATANFGNPECVYGTGCTFQVRTQAQKKNFWGNWVYSSFSPILNIVNANWSYSYSLMPSCTDYPLTFSNNIASTGNPTPTWSHFVPATNNGFFKMHPHTSGWWVFSGTYKYICNTFNITYNIPAFYHTYPPSTWNLTN